MGKTFITGRPCHHGWSFLRLLEKQIKICRLYQQHIWVLFLVCVKGISGYIVLVGGWGYFDVQSKKWVWNFLEIPSNVVLEPSWWDFIHNPSSRQERIFLKNKGKTGMDWEYFLKKIKFGCLDFKKPSVFVQNNGKEIYWPLGELCFTYHWNLRLAKTFLA